MGTEIVDAIMAAVTTDPTLVGGGIPVFVARSGDEQQQIALYISRILNGMAHDVGNGVMIIVKH